MTRRVGSGKKCSQSWRGKGSVSWRDGSIAKRGRNGAIGKGLETGRASGCLGRNPCRSDGDADLRIGTRGIHADGLGQRE